MWQVGQQLRSATQTGEGVTVFKLRLTVGVLLAITMALAFTVSASADPKNGCPAAEGWNVMGVDQAGTEIYPHSSGKAVYKRCRGGGVS